MVRENAHHDWLKEQRMEIETNREPGLIVKRSKQVLDDKIDHFFRKIIVLSIDLRLKTVLCLDKEMINAHK